MGPVSQSYGEPCLCALENIPAIYPITWEVTACFALRWLRDRPCRSVWDRWNFWIKQTSEMYCRVIVSPPLEKGKGIGWLSWALQLMISYLQFHLLGNMVWKEGGKKKGGAQREWNGEGWKVVVRIHKLLLLIVNYVVNRFFLTTPSSKQILLIPNAWANVCQVEAKIPIQLCCYKQKMSNVLAARCRSEGVGGKPSQNARIVISPYPDVFLFSVWFFLFLVLFFFFCSGIFKYLWDNTWPNED